jgi:hypothetical protein
MKDTDLKTEYDISKLGPGVRGKYHDRYNESTNVVVIDPYLFKEFPNTKAVNDALREILEQRKQTGS